jgi:hypothetical protein
MKKAIIGILVLAVVSVLVYAYTYDTDGGFNVEERGTCYDNISNYTDKCFGLASSSSQYLIEYFPMNDTNTSMCTSELVRCSDYNYTNCTMGRCI